MNIFQKAMHRLFNWQYVLLIHYDKEVQCKRAYKILDDWYSNPYSASTRVRLFFGGKIEGAIYVDGWKPATEFMKKLYSKDPVEIAMELLNEPIKERK